uniref:Ribosomal protein L10 n=1 Tax=Rhizophora mucronata TaxID=61149 RepID=A0A2P2J6Y3_RHIMU
MLDLRICYFTHLCFKDQHYASGYFFQAVYKVVINSCKDVKQNMGKDQQKISECMNDQTWKPNTDALVACLDYLKDQGDVDIARELLKMVREQYQLSADVQDRLSSLLNNGKVPVESEGLYEEDEDDNVSKNIVLFHTGGLTCNQWRKLKNLCSPGGRILFRPNSYGNGKKKRFFALLNQSAGPTCILYLAEEASNKHEFLTSLQSVDQDLLLLYGQHQSTLLDHKSVEKASSFDEMGASLFDFYLPAAYLSFLCSGV